MDLGDIFEAKKMVFFKEVLKKIILIGPWAKDEVRRKKGRNFEFQALRRRSRFAQGPINTFLILQKLIHWLFNAVKAAVANAQHR